MLDFFIDRIVKLKSPTKDVFKVIHEKEKFGGGSIRDICSLDTRGGNAVNIAYCLAKLGVRVTLFTIANQIGEAVLRKIFSKFDDDRVNLQIANGKHGHTTALEFVGEFGSKVNIMLNDVGDIANFGPERIGHERAKQMLKNADAVIVVNWGSNLRGSELVEYAFEQSPNSYHCIDPADMDARRFEFKDTLTRISNITRNTEQQSIFSNAYAALYVANPISEPATLDETIDFIEKNRA